MGFLTSLIIQFIHTTSYIGIFLLMTLESALIPIPSEVTMPFSGFLAAQGKLSFWLVVIAGTFGNLVGSLIGYYIGFLLEENVIIGYIKKYGKFVLVTEEDFHKGIAWFEKYGDPIVFVSRLLPAVRTFISLPAGLFEMNIWKFSIYTVLGSFLWSIFLTYVGFYFQSRWHIFEGYFRKFDYLILAVLVIAIVYYLNHKLKFLKLKKKS